MVNSAPPESNRAKVVLRGNSKARRAVHCPRGTPETPLITPETPLVETMEWRNRSSGLMSLTLRVLAY